MRMTVGLLAGTVLLAAGPVHAQVINGEGTYEGSTLHSPPPDPEPDSDDAKVPHQTGGTAVPRPQARD